MKDEEMWSMGAYVSKAIMATIGNSQWFKRKGTPTHEYPKKPFMSDASTTNNGELTEEEKQKQVDLFFARENARRVNWRRNHKRKDGTVS